MGFTATFRVDGSDLLLRKTIQHHPDLDLEISYVTTISPEVRTAFLITGRCHRSEFEASLEADETITDWTTPFVGPEFHVYRVNYSTDIVDVYQESARIDCLVDRVWATDGFWHVTVLVPSKDHVNAMRSGLDDFDIDYDLKRLHSIDRKMDDLHLSPAQSEMLHDAYTRGYFEVPRKVQQSALAADHGVTESAVSQIIRRSLQRVLDEYFSHYTPTSEPVFNPT